MVNDSLSPDQVQSRRPKENQTRNAPRFALLSVREASLPQFDDSTSNGARTIESFSIGIIHLMLPLIAGMSQQVRILFPDFISSRLPPSPESNQAHLPICIAYEVEGGTFRA
jgi:hypothetical protein